MERVVCDLVQCNVIKSVFQSPVSQRIAVAHATRLPWRFINIQPSPLVSLPPGSASDDDLSSQSLETPLKWLDLAQPVILLNVGLPQISAILFIIHGLGLSTLAGDS